MAAAMLAEEEDIVRARDLTASSTSDPSHSDYTMRSLSDEYLTRTTESGNDATAVEVSLCGTESTDCTARSGDESGSHERSTQFPSPGVHSEKWNLHSEKWNLRGFSQRGEGYDQARKGFKWEQQWESVFNDLVYFKQAFGHALVPRGAVGSRWNSLGQWVRHQRLMLKKGRMPVQRFERLVAFKFCWEEKNLGWEKMFDQLVRYRNEHGHANVAQCDSLLGKWVAMQRLLQRRNQLRKDRMFRLEVLGFQWEVRVPWHQNLMELVLYHQRTGTCDVPNTSIRLFRWISQQRTFCAKDKISSERLRLLENVGLEVDVHNNWWERNFVGMMLFRMNHGHLHVPANRAHTNLVQWLHRQRSMFRRGALKKWRHDRLAQLGIKLRYNARASFWNERYMDLLKFKDSHGHTNVPTGYAANPVLAQWVLNQRARHRRGKLQTERIARLDEVEFCWDAASHTATQERYRVSNSELPRKARKNPTQTPTTESQTRAQTDSRRSPSQTQNKTKSQTQTPTKQYRRKTSYVGAGLRSESSSSCVSSFGDEPKQYSLRSRSACKQRQRIVNV
jgi:hypothetical protein